LPNFPTIVETHSWIADRSFILAEPNGGDVTRRDIGRYAPAAANGAIALSCASRKRLTFFAFRRRVYPFILLDTDFIAVRV